MSNRIKINTYKESSLHVALKNWYAVPGDLIEGQVGNYVIDIIRGNTCIEIQTRNFHKIRSKLVDLLQIRPVRLVHPITVDKWIIRVAETGERIQRKKSPLHGRLEYLFKEMVHMPDLIHHPNFSLEILLIEEDEIRQWVQNGPWRKRGWSTIDRRLRQVISKCVFYEPEDYIRLLNPITAETFETQALATELNIPKALAYRMIYCLKHSGLIHCIGKRGRVNVYSRQAMEHG